MMLNQLLFIVFIASLIILLLDFIFIARKRTRKAPIIAGLEYMFIISGLFYFMRVENFEFVLTIATLSTGLIVFLDKVLLKRLRRYRHEKMKETREVLQPEEETYLSSHLSVLVDYSRSFFGILCIVLILRSFLFEPFRIPTGSLIPTLLPGDFILVNKFDYGLRLPIFNKKILKVHEPKRGDIVVFHWPVNPKIDFIKRVVGVPGDTISYVNKVFYINGEEAGQLYQRTEPYAYGDSHIEAVRSQENLLGRQHEIYTFPSKEAQNFSNLTVPEGMYFMIGDNRDDSADSRYWGFVPESNIVGKPVYVLFNWDSKEYRFLWKRSGLAVQAPEAEAL